MMKRLLLALLFTGLLSLPSSGRAPVAAPGVIGQNVVSSLAESGRVRVMVLFSGDDLSLVDLAQRSRLIAERRAAVLDQIPPDEFLVTHTFENISAVAGLVNLAGLKKLGRDYRVERIDLDIPGKMALVESTDLVHARELQATGITGKGVVVAVLDTGIDTDHPDLVDDIVAQQCFCANADGVTGCCPGGRTEASGAGAAEDDQGHGTHVAGIITSGGVVAPRGMAPDAKIVAVRVLDKTGAAASAAQLLKAFDWIIKSQPSVKVVNMSVYFGNFPGACDTATSFTAALGQAVNTLRARGTLTVAATGNEANKGGIGTPACLVNAIAVGATYDGNVGTISFGCTDGSTAADKVACFSNSSPAVDLLAPGAAISASGLRGGVASFAGTSQAVPHVVGALALLLQVQPGATAQQLEAALKSSGRTIADSNGVSAPRIDVSAAVAAIRR